MYIRAATGGRWLRLSRVGVAILCVCLGAMSSGRSQTSLAGDGNRIRFAGDYQQHIRSDNHTIPVVNAWFLNV
jgi:hypothetical protein